MNARKLVFGEGWHGEEFDGRHAFRWMTREARASLEGVLPPGRSYLVVSAGHSFPNGPQPRFEVSVNGEAAGLRTIGPAFMTYAFPIETEGRAEFTFRLDRDFTADGDTRRLGIMVRELAVVHPAELEDVLYAEGWYEPEIDEFMPFRWTADRAVVLIPPSRLERYPFLTLPVFSEFMDCSQVIEVSLAGRTLARLSLLNKLNFYSIPLDPEAAYEGVSAKAGVVAAPEQERASRSPFSPGGTPGPFELVFRMNKLFPPKFHPVKGRVLGIRAGPVEFHDDADWHARFHEFHANALLNYEEMRRGATELRSRPLNLGIDLYGKCNINPPCVYCLWDRMKKLEGDCVDTIVDRSTLEAYGRFFTSARTLVNCSFGEPLLHPQLADILDFCARNRKIVELSTNGQAFTDRTIRALAGKPVYLYISLDAATAGTYAKIRNDRWEEIVPNLVKLYEARKAAGNRLPKIYMVFMPMRVNRDELEEYFRLCRRIDADALVLRPLLYLWKPDIRVERGGYLFDYEKEMLDRDELEEIVAKAEECSRVYGIPMANQFNFGLIEEPGRKAVAGLGLVEQGGADRGRTP